MTDKSKEIGYNKKYYKMREVVEITGITDMTIRDWERHIPAIKPLRTESNQRRYSAETVRLIKKVAELRDEGYLTIKGIAECVSYFITSRNARHHYDYRCENLNDVLRLLKVVRARSGDDDFVAMRIDAITKWANRELEKQKKPEQEGKKDSN